MNTSVRPVALLHVLEQVEDLGLDRHVERRHRLVARRSRSGSSSSALAIADALALAAGEFAGRRLPTCTGSRPTASSASLDLGVPGLGCAVDREPSATMSRTLRRAFSDDTGSWKIICNLRRGAAQVAGSERASSSLPSKCTVPAVGWRSIITTPAHRRLAAARLADHAQRFTPPHVEADVGQGVQPRHCVGGYSTTRLSAQQHIVVGATQMRLTGSGHQVASSPGWIGKKQACR